jgi:hypothetical protein
VPTVLRDTDGLEDERRGIISVFDGPAPEVKSLATIGAESDAVRQTVETWLGGIATHEIGLVVRTPQVVARARAAVAGLPGEGAKASVANRRTPTSEYLADFASWGEAESRPHSVRLREGECGRGFCDGLRAGGEASGARHGDIP